MCQPEKRIGSLIWQGALSPVCHALCHARVLESLAMPRWGKKSNGPPPAPIPFVRIRVTSEPGKYAALSRKGDLLVVSRAQAGEFPDTEAPRRQRELERRGFKTKVEPT
jgi:hypothetical protein